MELGFKKWTKINTHAETPKNVNDVALVEMKEVLQIQFLFGRIHYQKQKHLFP